SGPSCRGRSSPERRRPRPAGRRSARATRMAAVLPVVILHRNRPDRDGPTVRRFLAQDVPGGVRVVHVDNGSTPANRDAALADLPDGVEVVTLPANVGFGPGANAG